MLRHGLVWILVTGFFLCGTVGAQPTQQMKNRELVNSLFASMHPDLPENSHLPLLVKEKLRWIIRESQAKPKRLTITATDRWLNADNSAIMSTVNDPGRLPDISVSAEAVALRAEKLSKAELKDMFLLCLTHEGVHMEVVLKSSAPDEEVFKDEVRTWRKWLIEAVRPMILQGRGILVSWVLGDQVLRGCNDNSDCFAFQQFVRTQVPKRK